MATTTELQPIDRLEEKVKQLVGMIESLRTDRTKALDAAAGAVVRTPGSRSDTNSTSASRLPVRCSRRSANQPSVASPYAAPAAAMLSALTCGTMPSAAALN